MIFGTTEPDDDLEEEGLELPDQEAPVYISLHHHIPMPFGGQVDDGLLFLKLPEIVPERLRVPVSPARRNRRRPADIRWTNSVRGSPPSTGEVLRSTASILPIRRTPSIRAPTRESRLGSNVFSVATPGASADSTSRGGSIPVMATFQKTHGLPCILMGFGLDDDNVHAPNEKFSLSSYFGGTKSVAYLYEELARTH